MPADTASPSTTTPNPPPSATSSGDTAAATAGAGTARALDPALDPARPTELALEAIPLPSREKYRDSHRRAPTEKSWDAMQAFLRGLRANGTITNGLLRAQIDRRTYNRWLHRFKEFAADCDLMRLEHREFLEDRLMYDIKKGDSIALRLKLRGEFPEKYGTPLLRRAAALPAAEALGPDPTAVEEIDIWADRQVHPPLVQ